MRRDDSRRSRCNRRHFVLLTVCGAVVALALHFYLLRAHDIPNVNAPAHGERQSQGSILAPIARDRALWLLLLGLVPPLVMRRAPWCAALAYTAGVAAFFTAVTLTPPLSNLWPIALVMVMALTAIPAFAGASVAAFAVAMFQGRRNGGM